MLRIRIHYIRIRIQHFRLKTNPGSVQIQGFDDQKLKKNYIWKFFIYQKLQITYP
jgi:hypothetical protein